MPERLGHAPENVPDKDKGKDEDGADEELFEGFGVHRFWESLIDAENEIKQATTMKEVLEVFTVSGEQIRNADRLGEVIPARPPFTYESSIRRSFDPSVTGTGVNDAQMEKLREKAQEILRLTEDKLRALLNKS